MKYICFVRHGESIHNNSQHKNEGEHETSVLSEKGNIDAHKFAESYAEEPSLIVTSKYTRSKETAAYLIKKFPKAIQEEWDDIHEFNYINNYSSIEEKKEIKKEYWGKNDPTYRHTESTENFSAFLARANRVLEKIRNSEHERIVIFSHAKFMRLIIILLTHSKYNDHSQAMKDLTSYSYRFAYCGTLTLLVDDDHSIYIKDLRKEKC